MLLGHERYYSLGMDALVTLYYALGTRTLLRELLWYGHECSHSCVLLEDERYYGLSMLWFEHGCSNDRMFLEHER